MAKLLGPMLWKKTQRNWCFSGFFSYFACDIYKQEVVIIEIPEWKLKASVSSPNIYCDKFKKQSMADTNDILWHYFHHTLFYWVFCDILVWYPSCVVCLFKQDVNKNSKCLFPIPWKFSRDCGYCLFLWI